MKNLIYLLLVIPLLALSCSKNDSAKGSETVEVQISAEVPNVMGTRATPTTVNTVYCAVFENNAEITSLRKAIDITDGTILFTPRLIKGRTYDIVFWASKAGSYNVTDLCNITRNPSVAEADFDAFTAKTSITVEGNFSDHIILKRPLAQLIMGVTPEDWSAVANPDTFNMLPTTIEVNIENGNPAFNALTGMAEGNETITYNLDVTGAEFTCESKTYKSIAMLYVMPEIDESTFSLSYTLKDQNGTPIRENAQIPFVPFERNYQTNVVGGLLTGTLTYTFTFEDQFLTDEEHKVEL